MDKKNTLFVINPVAGGGKQLGIEKHIFRNIDHDKFNVELIYTQHAKHASELRTLGIADKMDIIVAVGGDGSVNEVAKNLVNYHNVLGIIPMGSGNGLARHLGIPLDPLKAIKKINDYNVHRIDTATMNEQLFINVAGVGFDAEVSSKFAVFGKRGFNSYFRISLSTFLSYKPSRYKLIIDGEPLEREAFLIAIANSSQYGNNAYIAPQAKIDDGMLDISIVKKVNLMSLPGFGYHLFHKSLHLTNYCEFYRGREILIEHPSSLAHYDGESFEPGKSIRIVTHPGSLNVII